MNNSTKSRKQLFQKMSESIKMELKYLKNMLVSNCRLTLVENYIDELKDKLQAGIDKEVKKGRR